MSANQYPNAKTYGIYKIGHSNSYLLTFNSFSLFILINISMYIEFFQHNIEKTPKFLQRQMGKIKFLQYFFILFYFDL
jgi:hypothetical protein